MNALDRYKNSKQMEAKGFAAGMMILVKLSALVLAKEYGFGEKRLMRFFEAFSKEWVSMNERTEGKDKYGNKVKNDMQDVYDAYLDYQMEKYTYMRFFTDERGRLYIGHKDECEKFKKEMGQKKK